MTDIEGRIRFRRTVIGLRDAYCSVASLEVAARFALALRTQLLGIFVEDAGLLEWTGLGLPGAAGGPGTGAARAWTARHTFAAAERRARERLARIASLLGLEAGFEVERASAASLDLGDGGAADLIVVVEPAEPTARLSYPFTAVLEAVASHARPVLYVPSRVRSGAGPVVAMVGEADREAVELAGEIARRLGRDLIRIDPTPYFGEAQPGAAEESLIVLAREHAAGGRFARLAAQRKVPVLVVGEKPSA